MHGQAGLQRGARRIGINAGLAAGEDGQAGSGADQLAQFAGSAAVPAPAAAPWSPPPLIRAYRGETSRVCMPVPTRPPVSDNCVSASPVPVPPMVLAASSRSQSPAGSRCRITVRSTFRNR